MHQSTENDQVQKSTVENGHSYLFEKVTQSVGSLEECIIK